MNFHDLIVYSDSDIKIKNKRFLLKAFILAKMIDKCSFSNKDTILVIGCLTGYTLAIVSFLVGYAFGIDNDKKIIGC